MLKGHADIYALTPKGTTELKGGATSLEARELELLVLVDGRRPVSAIAVHANVSDSERVQRTLEDLMQRGYVRLASAPDAAGGFDYFMPTRGAAGDDGSKLADEAALGAAKLKEQGYYVSIARTSRAAGRTAGKGLAVLIVEDEPLVAKYLKTLIEMEGHVARLAANRAEITAALEAQPRADLAILDVVLPDANGFDVLQQMKDDPRTSDIPVMMVTTQATRESVMKGLALGADGYFTKPFEVETLLRGLAAVLGTLPAGQAAAKAPPLSADRKRD